MPVANVISAGVYDSNNVLVRTLWSNRPQTMSASSWDGLLDDGSIARTGTYTIKGLTGSPVYTWEGVIGNTNLSSIGANQYGVGTGPMQHSDVMFGMAINAAGTIAYYCVGFNEARVSTFKMALSNNNAVQAPSYILYQGFDFSGTFTLNVCVDSTNVYWSGYGGTGGTGGKAQSFVYGSLQSNDTAINFAHASTVTMGSGASYHGIDVQDVDPNNLDTITAIAVQNAGSWLFIARHGTINNVHVVDKTGLAAAGTLALTGVVAMCVDGSDNLWVVSGTTATKYSINAGTGAISSTLGSITGLTAPLAIAVNGTTVAIVDGGTSQQVKFYNNTTFAVNGSPVGTAGGYPVNGPAVTNTKFMFDDIDSPTVPSRTPVSFITFNPNDASFWFGDPGNARNMHFNSSRTYVEQMAWVPTNYCDFVCRNDPTRVFSWYWEYSVDYSKPIGSCWTLVNNWSVGTSSFLAQGFIGLNQATTIEGKTYAMVVNPSNNFQIYELVAGSGIRDTGVILSSFVAQMNPNGDLVVVNQTGSTINWTTTPLLSIDGSNNPVYGSPSVTSSVTVALSTDPIDSQGRCASRFVTDGGILPVFNATCSGNLGQAVFSGTISGTTLSATFAYGSQIAAGMYIDSLNVSIISQLTGTPGGTGTYRLSRSLTVSSPQTMTSFFWKDQYHLGGVSNNQWMFKVARSTPKNFGSNSLIKPNGWPIGGFFPVTPVSMTNGGSAAMVAGTNIVYGFFGEDWGGVGSGVETNKWRHYHESGLMVGEFGVLGNRIIDPITAYWNNDNSQAGMAGNANNPQFVIVNGIGYVYHNDESFKMGVHRWRMDGLSTISVANEFVVSWNSSLYVVPAADPGNLLAGLPISDTVANNTAGWTRSPTTDDPTNLFGEWWAVQTGSRNSDPNGTPDISLSYAADGVNLTGNASAIRTIPPGSFGQSWTLSCQLQLLNGFPFDTNSYVHIEVADVNGLLLVQFVMEPADIKINGTTFLSPGSGGRMINIAQFPQLLSIQYLPELDPTVDSSGNAQTVSFNVTYGSSTQQVAIKDATANPAAPGTFAIRYHYEGLMLASNRNIGIDISDLRID
jgi:hypothetical protein